MYPKRSRKKPIMVSPWATRPSPVAVKRPDGSKSLKLAKRNESKVLMRETYLCGQLHNTMPRPWAKITSEFKKKTLGKQKKNWQTEMPSVTHVPSILLICLFEVGTKKKMATETSSCECQWAKILVVWSAKYSPPNASHLGVFPNCEVVPSNMHHQEKPIGFEKAPHKAQTSCWFSVNDCHNLKNLAFVTTAQGPMALIVF